MKLLIRSLLVLLVLTAGLSFYHPYVTGTVLEPFLEAKLSSLFGMKVEIDQLRADLVSGRVSASRITFFNQTGFTTGPHLDVRGIDFDIRFPALRDKKVLIGEITLNRPYYFIERIKDQNGKAYSNLSEWVDHIESDDSPGEKDSPAPSVSKKWEVSIQKIQLKEGKFVFLNREVNQPSLELVFDRLNGFLKGFHWPVKDPAFLEEEVSVSGLFGKKFPSPFIIKGYSNFATSQVSFDLLGEIADGDVLEHAGLWDGLPLKVEGGRFSLKLHAVAKKRMLDSESLVTLRNLEVAPRWNLEGTLWGLPLAGSIAILERKKTIQLVVPVSGDIAHPEYGFDVAFRKAFQEALGHYAESGMDLLKNTSSKIFEHGRTFAEKAPSRIFDGLAELSSAVIDATLDVKDDLSKGPRETPKTDKPKKMLPNF